MCESNKRALRTTALAGGDGGVALITALAFLVLFSLIGSAYVGYMLIERSATRYEIDQVRNRQAAEAGVHAAIGAIQQQLQSGSAVVAPADWSFSFPVYRTEGEVLAAAGEAPHEVIVRLTDENARVNVNFAPLGVLESIVGIDRETWRQIRSGMPRVGELPDGDHQWLARVDELVSRGLEQGDFDKLDQDLLTVYTVEDLLNPRGFININTASPEVIAAVLNISIDHATAIADGPPLSSIEEVAYAAGKDVSAFTLPPSPGAPPNASTALGFESRTFRLVSTSTGRTGGKGGSRVEAVVLFRRDGTAETRFWSSGRAGSTADDSIDEASSAPNVPLEEPAPVLEIPAPEDNLQGNEPVT